MRIPLPFPKCPKCKESYKQSTHKDCGGLLEIEPYLQEVYCTRCSNHWNLWDSEYHCRCEHIFRPKDVNKAIKTMLNVCKTAIDELERRNLAIRERNDLYRSSVREFLISFMGTLGNWAGLAIETIFQFFKK